MNRHQPESIRHKRLAAVVAIALLGSPLWVCGAEQSRRPALSIDETGLPLGALMDRIANQTGYRVELAGNWPDTPLRARFHDVPLEEGLRSLLKQTGRDNYALLIDHEKKQIRIATLAAGSQADLPVRTSAPPAGVDEGVSRESLHAIKHEHADTRQTLPPDTEISPPSKRGSGLTLEQLEEIKQRHREARLHGNTGGTPWPDLSEADLAALKEAHRRKQQQALPAETEVSPPSGDRPGITQAQLDEIKKRHKNRVLSGDRVVSPPSEQGRGMTEAELAAIKQAHSKAKKSTPGRSD